MVQEFHVLRCFSCKTFQVHQVKKCKKWNCKICGEKQSIIKVYGQGSGADCRGHVQKLNMMQGEATQAAEINVCGQEDEFPEEILPQDDCLSINSQRATDAGAGISRWTKFLDNSRGEPAVEEGLVDEEENVYTDKDHFYTEKRVVKRNQRKCEKDWNSCNPSLEESVNSDHCEFRTRWKKARQWENWGRPSPQDKKDLISLKENAGKSMILGQPLPPPKATANKKTSLGLKDSTIPEYCTNNSTGMTASKWERFLPSTTREDESDFSPQSEKDLQHSQTFTTPLAFCSALDMPSQLKGTGSLTLVDKALQRKRSKLTAEGGLSNEFPPSCTQPTSSFVSPIVSTQALTTDPLQPSFCSLFQTDEDFDETF
ncbi:MRN complex-interacting protein isoform X1 [Acipenser ruthenus]|uniref:MRN complex-interacting protein isoform X1 n=1 Tax=Acipenser ruthenus TaxID=7906 RepID=UPI00145AA14B|nr:MRN complex-interacting protein isoform X1 [Acipenser ruthenus]